MPDYQNKQTIPEDNYTAVADGYVRLYNGLGSILTEKGTSVQAMVQVNGEVAYNFSLYLTSSDMYISCDSGPIPVKKGDTVLFAHLGNDTPGRFFYPIRW